MLQPVAGAVDLNGQVDGRTRVSLPLRVGKAEGQELHRLTGDLLPEGLTEGIGRAGEDLLLVRLHPALTLDERYHLPAGDSKIRDQALALHQIRPMAPQGAHPALVQLAAASKLEQRALQVPALRREPRRLGIDPAAIVCLPGQIEGPRQTVRAVHRQGVEHRAGQGTVQDIHRARGPRPARACCLAASGRRVALIARPELPRPMQQVAIEAPGDCLLEVHRLDIAQEAGRTVRFLCDALVQPAQEGVAAPVSDQVDADMLAIRAVRGARIINLVGNRRAQRLNGEAPGQCAQQPLDAAREVAPPQHDHLRRARPLIGRARSLRGHRHPVTEGPQQGVEQDRGNEAQVLRRAAPRLLLFLPPPPERLAQGLRQRPNHTPVAHLPDRKPRRPRRCELLAIRVLVLAVVLRRWAPLAHPVLREGRAQGVKGESECGLDGLGDLRDLGGSGISADSPLGRPLWGALSARSSPPLRRDRALRLSPLGGSVIRSFHSTPAAARSGGMTTPPPRVSANNLSARA